MATAELKVRIEAEIGDLGKKLKTANNDIANFGNKATNTLKNTSSSASSAISGLGDVAQNASGGIESVTGSIAPMIQSFTRIRSESGSTQGAIKSVTSALSGGGGLTLALSLAATALVILIKEPEKAAYALNYLSGSIQKVTADQKLFNEELVKNKASALIEINSLNDLIAIAKNETISRDARTEAIKKLNKEYPEQLGSLTLEGIESKKTALAIDILSASLLRKAKIEAASKLLGEAFTKQLQAQTKSTIEQASVLSSAVGFGLNVIGIKNTVALTNGLSNQSEAYKKAGEEAKTYQDIISKLTTESAIDGTLFNDSVKTAKADKQQFARGKQISIERLNSLDTFLAKYKATEAEINKTPLIGFPPDINTRLAAPLDNLKLNLLPQLQGSFQTFFDEILIRGKLSFDALGKSILNTFASVLANQATTGVLALLGDKDSKAKGNIFATGAKFLGGLLGGGGGKGGGEVATKGLGKILGTALPFAGIALAGASILGGLFKKKSVEPTPAFTTSNAISTSSSSNVDFGNGRVVFEISGVNLVGVLNRAGAKLQRFGP